MKVVVIYESMFGATKAVAEAIAEGLAGGTDVLTVPVACVAPETTADADAVVVGGPTHAHARSRPATRRGAPDYAKPGSGLTLEPGAADGPGVRDLDGVVGGGRTALAAAFDTRVDIPAALSGRASKGIARSLRSAGLRLVAEPESFLVDKGSHLLDGELDRARAWGTRLADQLVAARRREPSTPG